MADMDRKNLDKNVQCDVNKHCEVANCSLKRMGIQKEIVNFELEQKLHEQE